MEQRIVDQAPRRDRGSALWEFLPLSMLLVTLVSAIMMAAYLFMGRNLIFYHGEQTLYCAAEGRPKSICLRELRVRLKRQLPWGEVINATLDVKDNEWILRVHWRFGELVLKTDRRLKASSLSS